VVVDGEDQTAAMVEVVETEEEIVQEEEKEVADEGAGEALEDDATNVNEEDLQVEGSKSGLAPEPVAAMGGIRVMRRPGSSARLEEAASGPQPRSGSHGFNHTGAADLEDLGSHGGLFQ
jgi:hypothetical protein